MMDSMKKKTSMVIPCVELVARTTPQMNSGFAATYVRGGSMASV